MSETTRPLRTEYGAPAVLDTADRRRFERHDSREEALCYMPGKSASPWTVRLRDVSEGGAGLEMERMLMPGTQLILELRPHGAGSPMRVCARVAHATPLTGGKFVIGCSFKTRLSPSTVAALSEV